MLMSINIAYASNSIGTVVVEDYTSPNITILSPINKTYSSLDVNLNVSADENISAWWYSLNGVNSTFTPNTTISARAGSNSLIVYANDTNNNTGSSSITFNVKLESGWNIQNTSIVTVNTTSKEDEYKKEIYTAGVRLSPQHPYLVPGATFIILIIAIYILLSYQEEEDKKKQKRGNPNEVK